MIKRKVYIFLLVVFIGLTILLTVTSLGNNIANFIFENVDLITKSFEVMIVGLVVFNWILAAIIKVRYRPAGNVSLHEVFGPLGDIFNFGFFGLLIYEIFLTAITILSASLQGSLASIIPQEPLLVLDLIMLLLLGFSGYIIFTMFQTIWLSPAFNREKITTPN